MASLRTQAELRVGDLRIFYELTSETPARVTILAVGRKDGKMRRWTGLS